MDLCETDLPLPCRPATPPANRGIGRYAAARGEFGSPFLNGPHRSV